MGEEQNETKDGAAAVDLRKLYRFEPEELQLDITHSSYSNLAYVQVAHRDVCIDFLEMPGVRREGRALVNGTRVYMSHAAAQKLAEALSGILERVHTEEGMEKYVPGGLEVRASSTKVERK
ncbi:DUF3467 domain-containing protein [Methanoculleus sp. 10]|uniref:DUF3467 domain-containing protein n=1 Tax=Methanoculleus sp. 10 TaxID=430615 RepID=UPI0025CF143B|nr:DUF3467 domain-containing protein [Methanoculleus sp. 10]